MDLRIIKDYGELSVNGGVYFRFVEWYGKKRYDVRRWGDNGKTPKKGLAFDDKELEKLASVLSEGIKKFKSGIVRQTEKIGNATIKIYDYLGGISDSGGLDKQLLYADWGTGKKYDLRPWDKIHKECGKGITLSEIECKKLLEIIQSQILSPVQYGISFEDFLVRSNIFRCNKRHNIETIQTFISILNSRGEVVNEVVSAGYCKQCNCYFILEKDYMNLRAKGLPLCRQITEKAYMENGENIFSGEGLNPQSQLNILGYNVNANENLSSTQRQNILSFAVETGLYTISGICSFLDWLIDKNEKVMNRDMSEAIEKWSQDRNYIAKYKLGTLPMKGVRSLKGRSVR